MEILNGTSLSNKVDYSFGDHLGGLDPVQLPSGFSKPANDSNTEFVEKCKEFEGKIMTLFIDNIRLYPRSLQVEQKDAPYVAYLMQNNNLLWLCDKMKDNKFIIFTSHEDTPIDELIKIPDNVLGIHAVNAAYFNEKIHPFPYGLQRVINRTGGDIDNRLEIMKEEIDKPQTPTKLLYINCGLGRNPERMGLVNFTGLSWTTTRFNEDSMFFPYSRYREFLTELRDHKFVICPEGHGMDCHRNWETLYMRRVPIMKKSPYFAKLMLPFPVLFVDEWSDVTEELLKRHDHLYREAQDMDLGLLDLNLIYEKILKSYV